MLEDMATLPPAPARCAGPTKAAVIRDLRRAEPGAFFIFVDDRVDQVEAGAGAGAHLCILFAQEESRWPYIAWPDFNHGHRFLA